MDIFPTFSFFLTNLSSVFSTFMDKTPPKRIFKQKTSQTTLQNYVKQIQKKHFIT